MCACVDCFRDGLNGKLSHDTMSHDDVRRSLEVLDSVLAEFDDCLESWDNLATDKILPGNESLRISKYKETANDTISLNSFSYDGQLTDGSTSHDSGVSLQEQVKVTSPPPVPKRNASTKLSDRGSGLFTFPPVDNQSIERSASQDNGTKLSINAALSAREDDEVFSRADNNANKVHYCCVKCGKEIAPREEEHAMDKVSREASFSEKCKMFEDRIGDSKISASPLLERSFTGSSFKGRTGRFKESESEPSSLTFFKAYESEQHVSESVHSSFASRYSPKATKVTPPRVDGLLSLPSNLHHAPNCNCRERFKQLQLKFAETRRLLKANKIKGLDSKPPTFVPPPPPPEVVAKNARNNENHVLINDKPTSNGFTDSVAISDSNSYSASNGSLNSESLNSEMSDNPHPSSPLPDYENSSPIAANEQKLCNKCSAASDPSPISETIEDIPKLLPTDALKRPHLGLSYCMEDDFSPGVKEILQTSSSLSRNGLSFSRNSKTNSLSTFSLSDSSLGYVSSQSDLELSGSPYSADKVPVSSVKFSTLPEGMNLHSLPSYYGQDSTEKGHHNNKSGQQPVVYRDRNFNHTTDPQLRSSSAPPPPLEVVVEKPKKRHFRGFSRKEKKDKKKNSELNIEQLAGR